MCSDVILIKYGVLLSKNFNRQANVCKSHELEFWQTIN